MAALAIQLDRAKTTPVAAQIYWAIREGIEKGGSIRGRGCPLGAIWPVSSASPAAPCVWPTNVSSRSNSRSVWGRRELVWPNARPDPQCPDWSPDGFPFEMTPEHKNRLDHLPPELAAAVREFIAWSDKQLFAEQVASTPKEPLYHDTGEAALKGILTNQHLWCFRACTYKMRNTAIRPMSALAHFADSSRTSAQVPEVPKADIDMVCHSDPRAKKRDRLMAAPRKSGRSPR